VGLQVHLARTDELANKAHRLHTGRQLVQISPPEVLGQVARSVELADEALHRGVVRFSGERGSNAQEAPPRPLLRVFDEHGQSSQVDKALFR